MCFFFWLDLKHHIKRLLTGLTGREGNSINNISLSRAWVFNTGLKTGGLIACSTVEIKN